MSDAVDFIAAARLVCATVVSSTVAFTLRGTRIV
jgi:hypothetical protein